MLQAVTIERIEEIVKSSQMVFSRPDDTLTICLLRTPSGSVLVGKSACINPTDYKEEEANNLALQNAAEQLWDLETYLLNWIIKHGGAHEAGGVDFIKQVEEGKVALASKTEESRIITLNKRIK